MPRFNTISMKRKLGLLLALIGILAVASALIFTPNRSNPMDSENGLDFGTIIFFSSEIVFGAGVVIYASTFGRKLRSQE